MLLIQDVIVDNEMLQKIGLATIGISVINFAINTLPILCQLK